VFPADGHHLGSVWLSLAYVPLLRLLLEPSQQRTQAEPYQTQCCQVREYSTQVLALKYYSVQGVLTQVLLCTGCTYTSITLYKVYLHKCYSVQGVLTQVLLCTRCTYTSITLYRVYLHKYYLTGIVRRDSHSLCNVHSTCLQNQGLKTHT